MAQRSLRHGLRIALNRLPPPAASLSQPAWSHGLFGLVDCRHRGDPQACSFPSAMAGNSPAETAVNSPSPFTRSRRFVMDPSLPTIEA